MSKIRLKDIKGYSEFKNDTAVSFFKCEDEYPGWTGKEKFVIVTDIPEEELLIKYADIMGALRPYLIMESKYGDECHNLKNIERRSNRFAENHQTSYGFDENTECCNEELIDYFGERKMIMSIALREALNMLTEKQKNRLILHYVYCFSYVDISKMEHLDEKAIRKSVEKSIKKLKKFLE